MPPVRLVSGRAIPFGAANVDTDLIIPARWLKTVTREGLGAGAFEALRRDPANIFDQPENRGAPILIAGANFGCGSSREHAAWALLDMGVRAVIAAGFSDIFAGNAFKNGLVTVALPQPQIDRLLVAAQTAPVSVDLETQTVTTPYQDRFPFALDPFRRHCLMSGLDEIGQTLEAEAAVERYETMTGSVRPWLRPVPPAPGAP